MTTPAHKSVLLEPVLQFALPDGATTFVDATFGLGGHTRAIMQKNDTLKTVIGIDQDNEILEHAMQTFSDKRLTLCHARASDLREILTQAGIKSVDGILLDLGVSSYQLDNPLRGFSFSKPGPLDMRMDQQQQFNAEELINTWEKSELVRIFRAYGEEKFSGRIADAIIRTRAQQRITQTDQLASIICNAVPAKPRNKQLIHPATRVFQAIRIAVNKELEEIERFLETAIECLSPGGHLSIISFHSLEDRIVKTFFNKQQKGCECPPQFPVCICGHKPQLEILTRKAIFADDSEIALNPRSRSARLRSARKLTPEI